MLIAGASVASAMAVIGIGAAVSASALPAEETFDEVTVAMIGFGSGTDDPIQCTFDDVPLPSTMPLPAGAEGSVAVGSVTVGAGEGAPAGVLPDGQPPLGPTVIVASGSAPISIRPGEAGTVESGGEPIDGPVIAFHTEAGTVEGGVTEIDGELPPPPPGAMFISSDDVREGTDEECAALREQRELLAP